jgi:predicted MFS family arabinose efflux permease
MSSTGTAGDDLNGPLSPARGSRVQAWMSSWIAVGAAQDAVLPILVPAYVIAVTGSASYSGVVMGVLMLTGALGPALGRLADRYRAHRLVLVLGNFGLALACVAYGLSSERGAILILDAVLLGASISAVSTVAPVFVLSARLGPKLEANRLTTLNLTQPVGQMLLGGALAAAASAGWSFPARFYLAAAILAVFAVLVWFTSAGPARNIHIETSPADPDNAKGEQVTASKPKVLTGGFGLVLGVAFLTSVAFQSVVGQIGNILPEVFGFSQTGTASLVSTAGLVAIGVFFVAGRMLQTKGAATATATGVVLRAFAILGLAFVGAVLASPIVVASVLVLVLYASDSFVDLAIYPLGVRAASVRASEASGWVFGAIALAGALGSVLSGVLADAFGFNSINWLASVAGAGAVVLMLVASGTKATRPQAQRQPPSVP